MNGESKSDAGHDPETVMSTLSTVLAVAVTLVIVAIVGSQVVGVGSSQPTFAPGGVEADFNNTSIEMRYLDTEGTADYVEVTFWNGSVTGRVRLHTPGARATLSRGVIDTTGDADVVQQPDGSLSANVFITAVAFKSEGNGETSSTLIYQGCTGNRCLGNGHLQQRG